MGCNLSRTTTGEKPSSKNGQLGKETSKQPEKNASLATVCISPPRETDAKDRSYEGKLPDGITETLQLPKETNGEQNKVIRSKFAKKPMGLTERERQTSADILEELRSQGIIKTTSAASQNRQEDKTMTRVEQLKQESLNDRTITNHESRTTGSKGNNTASEVQKASRTLKLLSLNPDSRNLTQKEEREECCSFQDFDAVESDANYNTVFEAF